MNPKFPSLFDLVLIGLLATLAFAFVHRQRAPGAARDAAGGPAAGQAPPAGALHRGPTLVESARALTPSHGDDATSPDRASIRATAVQIVREQGLRHFVEAVDIASLDDKEIRRYAGIAAGYTIRLYGFERFAQELESAQLRPAVRDQFAMVGGGTDITCRDLVLRTDVARRADWLERITDDPRALGAMFGTWSRIDFNAAAKWLSNRQPAPKYDRVAMWVVDAMVESGNPEAAEEWLPWITDPEQRERLAGFVDKHLERSSRQVSE